MFDAICNVGEALPAIYHPHTHWYVGISTRSRSVLLQLLLSIYYHYHVSFIVIRSLYSLCIISFSIFFPGSHFRLHLLCPFVFYGFFIPIWFLRVSVGCREGAWCPIAPFVCRYVCVSPRFGHCRIILRPAWLSPGSPLPLAPPRDCIGTVWSLHLWSGTLSLPLNFDAN